MLPYQLVTRRRSREVGFDLLDTRLCRLEEPFHEPAFVQADAEVSQNLNILAPHARPQTRKLHAQEGGLEILGIYRHDHAEIVEQGAYLFTVHHLPTKIGIGHDDIGIGNVLSHQSVRTEHDLTLHEARQRSAAQRIERRGDVRHQSGRTYDEADP